MSVTETRAGDTTRCRTSLRHRAAVVVATIAALATVVVVPAATRADAASCSATSGVTVIVDFSHFGGGIQRGCAPSPSNGVDALEQAGFTPTGTSRYGLAFMCRIDNEPSPQADPCVDTPPSSAYWSYYHAKPSDGSWTYYSVGALSSHPQQGSIEAWAFGAKALPGIAPDDAIPPPPTTAPPTTTPPTSPPPVRGQGGSQSPPTGGGRSSGASSATTTGTATSAGAASSPAGRAGATTSVPSSPTSGANTATQHSQRKPSSNVAAVPLESPKDKLSVTTHGGSNGDSPLPTIATVFAIALVGGGGAFYFRKRRLRGS